MPATSFIQRSRQSTRPPHDRAGLPLSTCPEAAALYREAMDREHGAQAGVGELLAEAIAHDSAFALAHVARWKQAHADSDARLAGIARDAALASLDGVTEWERSHVECVAAMIQRQPGAWTKAKEHLARHPLDLSVATQLIGDLFFHGGPGKRQAVMDVLQALAPHHSDDWAFTARLGFHLSELGDPDGAIEILDLALRGRPHAPFVAHAMAHALLESGRRQESYRFLLDWTSRHDPAGPIDGHIQWHLSLGELECAEPAAAVKRYLQWSAPGASHCAAGLLLADAGGLFCRMALDGFVLYGMPRAELLQLLTSLQRAFKIPFVAVHAAALAIVLGDHELTFEAIDVSMRANATDAERLVVCAFKAYLAGDFAGCIQALERDRSSQWEAVGGSNEERALIAKLYRTASAQIVPA